MRSGVYKMLKYYEMSKDNIEIRYAGVWYRFLARIIDNFFISIVGAPLLVFNVVLNFQNQWDSIISGANIEAIHHTTGQSLAIGFSTLFYILITVTYYVFFNASKYQATPGKMILGIKIITPDGGRLSLAQSFIRYLATDGIGLPGNLLSNSTNQTVNYISIPFLVLQGFWTIVDASIGGADTKKRMLHDRIAKTFVVYR